MALNVQGDLRKRLADALAPIEVRVNVPEDRPETLVTVTREGGARLNVLQDSPGIGIYCYAPTEQKAWELADKVADFMQELQFADGYELIVQETMYSDPDPYTRTPRWYLSYTITTHKPNN